MSNSNWENVGALADKTWRLKVDGGHIYHIFDDGGICFVPDIDLQRYQAHLRDAYRQGYTAGHQDAKNGIEENV